MKNHFRQISLLAVMLGAGLPISNLQAQNTLYAPGDLLLFFQKQGGSNTVYVNLGKAATLYRGSAAGPTAALQQLNIINISAQLSAAFDVEAIEETPASFWQSDTKIYAGLAAARSSSTGTNLIDADQTRTLYVSRPRNSVGTLGLADSTPWDLTSGQPYTGSAGAIIAMGNPFDLGPNSLQSVFTTAASNIDDQNPFLSPGIQGTAFGGFAGGVQQVGSASAFGSFGLAGSVEFALDLNRIVPRLDSETTGVEVTGIQHIGTYEGTVVVGTDGNVSFMTQGTLYINWINNSYVPLYKSADRTEGADPDADGQENLLEFVLNGNPAVSDQSVLPTLNASGSNFVFSFSRRADSVSEVTQIFEYSTDLSDWTTKSPITIPTTPGTVGFVSVGPSTGTAPNEVQAVTITIPKGSDTTLFGRLKAVK